MTAPAAASGLPRATLVLGGQRSGKSGYAEALVADGQTGACVYLATARAGDAEMAARIQAHRARRGPRWTTVEEPVELPDALARAAAPDRAVLVDCLTLWLANLLGAERDPETAARELVRAIGRLEGPVVFVSNEVGQGVVPTNALARAFVDHAGRLHQAVAGACDRVVFLTAGLPHTLKSDNEGR
jgi:adenosylcobinamide kinase/adenosylcobinamide-phosphate guanylyltransferase